jgi:hypothetical protein
MLDVASSLTRSWANVYTRGLSVDQRESRIAEIDSDLWEHQVSDAGAGIAAADTGFEMLTRFILGMPADLLWRRSAIGARSARSAVPLTNMEGKRMFARFMAGLAPVLVIVLAIFQLMNGVGILLGVHEEFVWGILEFSTGALLLVGLFLTKRSPRVGSGIIIATVVVAAGLHFWMAILAFPVALLIVAAILFRVRNLTPAKVTPA